MSQTAEDTQLYVVKTTNKFGFSFNSFFETKEEARDFARDVERDTDRKVEIIPPEK